MAIQSDNIQTAEIRQRNGTTGPTDVDEEVGLVGQEGILPPEVPSGEQGRERSGLFRKAKMGLLSRRRWKHIGVVESLKAIATSSSLNVFIIFIPLAWVAHFQPALRNHRGFTLSLCFLALVPLEHMFDWGGEQIALYCGRDLGDLIIITLNNIVEATLAIILLARCELRLLQSTIVGVVILHLLLIPGAAFITGGARILHQDLHADSSQLNHTLLTVGVMSLLLPAAFFSALDHGVATQVINGETIIGGLVNDKSRHQFLIMSRGLAVILLVLYIMSRVYMHNPPPAQYDHAHLPLRQPSREHTRKESQEEEVPVANPWVLIVVLLLGIGIMAATTEWLVESVEVVRQQGGISQEWFGMILLPIASFAANGFVAVIYFVRYIFRHFFKEPAAPTELAKARAIDLSIQFTLFWMPFFVLLAWWIGKPLTLLFDFFEIAILLAACFIVNYVTADAKTNWAEGYAMVSFYVMIALTVWFYTGQPEIQIMLGCDSVVENIAKYAQGGLEGEH